MKNFKGSAHLLLIVIVLVGLGFLMYFSAKNGDIGTTPTQEPPTPTTNNDQNSKPITPQIPTSETQISSTENYWLVSKSKTFPDWNTYTHKSYSFSIDLPSNWNFDWSILKNENNEKIGELSPGKLTIKAEEITCNDYFDRVVEGGNSIRALETNVSFEKYGHEFEENPVREEYLLSGKKWYLLQSKIGVEPNPEGITYWYPHQYCYENQQKLFLITFYELSLPNKNKQTINQILSTFKFTD